MRVRNFLCCLAVFFIQQAVDAEAGQAVFYKEMNMIGGYSNEDGWTGEKDMSLSNSIGCEYYKKFSSQYGDYLTMNVQLRFAYDSSRNSRRAWGIEIHNAWIDYKIGLGKTVRLGHFDPSFGLEPVLDTHSTLHQTLAPKSIGFKKDWGIGYRGCIGRYDYEISAQIGSGMSIKRKDGSYLLTARIGTPLSRTFQYGLSFLVGETLQNNEMKTIPSPEHVSTDAHRKKRIGIDAQYTTGSYVFRAETAYGTTRDEQSLGLLTEAQYRVPAIQELTVHIQGHLWQEDLEEHDARDMTIAPVLSYRLTSTITLRVGYFHDVYHSSRNKDRRLFLQMYYYGS